MGTIHLSATFTNSGALTALPLDAHVFLPSSEMAAIRSVAAGVLDKPCVVYRKTRTPDGFLGATETLAPIAAVMAGMSQPTAGQLANYDFLIGALAAWQVKLPYGTPVATQDHLSIAGQTLVVQVILYPRSFASVITVLASEINPTEVN